MWKISGKQNFCKGNLILACTQRCLLEEPKRNLSMRQRRLWKEKRPTPSHPSLRCANRVVLCALRSQEQRPRTALPGPRLSVTLLRAPLGPSVFFHPLSQSWGRDPGPGCLLKASSQGNPADPAAICGQLSPLVHGKTNSWFPVPAPRLSMHCPGASY